MRAARSPAFALSLSLGLSLIAVGAAATPPPVLDEQEQIQAAVLRHELTRFSSRDFGPAPLAFCVKVRAHVGEPSAQLLADLAPSYKRVLSAPQCKLECPPESPLGEQPMPVFLRCGHVSAGDAWFDAPDAANVSVNFFAGPLWGRSGVYKLRRVEGRWRITAYELRTVS